MDIFPLEEVVPVKLKTALDFVYIRCLRGIHNYSDRFIEKLLGYLCYLPVRFCISVCRCWTKLFHTHKWGNTYGWLTPGHFKETDIFPIGTIEFEGRTFSAPADPDRFLKVHYGDYMQIPPEKKRFTHLAKVTFLDEAQ